MKQHLENLTIERFRGLRDLELKDLGQVNLFVGPNNSGKTSVLEAIAIYCRPMDPLEWLNTARRREASSRSIPIVRLSAMRWLFPQTVEHKPDDLYHERVQMHATGEFAVRSVTADYQEVRGVPDANTLRRIQQKSLPSREPEEGYQGAELQVAIEVPMIGLFGQSGQLETVRSSFVLWEAASFYEREKSSAPASIKVKTITPVSHRTETAQVSRFSQAALNRDIADVLGPIQRFDPDIMGLQVLEAGGTSLYIDHKKTGLTPLSAFGDGVRRVVMMALTLPQVKDGVLLIDEIETAIHISVLKEVYHWLFTACQQFNIQLFATTHSLEAVDALLQAPPPAQAGLVAYRLGQANEPAKRYSDSMLKRLRGERGLDVR